MVVFEESCFTWNTRFICVQCQETTWKRDERILTAHGRHKIQDLIPRSDGGVAESVGNSNLQLRNSN